MDWKQTPARDSGMNNRYQQPQMQDIEQLISRTRRQFLITASSMVGVTALLLGGEALFSRPNPLAFLKNPTCVNNSSGTGGLSAANPVTMTVCQGSKSVTFFPFYVAQQQGFFAAQGLKIADPAILQVGSQVAAAVKADRYQIGNGVITDAFGWASTDSGARIVGAFINAYTVDIIVTKQFEQEMGVSPTSTLPNKVNALRGKTIGITGPGSATQGLLTYLFRKEGMNAAKDIKQVSLGANSAAALAALKSGRVDALSFILPMGQLVEVQGIGDRLISPMRGDIPGLVGDVHGVIYTKQSTIDANPQAIAAYIRAIGQAETFIQSNPAEAKVLLNKYLGLGQTVTDAVYTEVTPAMAKSPQISQAAYNVAGQFHVQAGLVSLIPSYGQLVATGTIASALGKGGTSCPS